MDCDLAKLPHDKPLEVAIAQRSQLEHHTRHIQELEAVYESLRRCDKNEIMMQREKSQNKTKNKKTQKKER